MVEFFSMRRPEQKPVYAVAVDRPENKAVIKARPNLIRNAISYWIDSDEPQQYIIGSDSFDARVSDGGDISFAQGVLEVSSVLVDSSEQGTYPEVILAKAQQKDAGSLVGVTANFPDNLKAQAFNDEKYNGDKLASDLFEWVLDNKKRVTLGYGPEHPLDDIQPLSVSDDYDPSQDDDIVGNFSNWLRTLVAATAISSNEHAFYVDENNNSIGVIAGGRTSVRYPSALPGETTLSAHTHPTIKSIAFPSSTDLSTNAFRCTDNSVEIIVSANAHTNLLYDRSPQESNHPEGAAAEYPFTEAPVVLVKREQALTEGEIEDHHASQSQKIKKMMDQQLDLKKQGIDSVKDQLSQAAFSLLESEFDKALIARDKVVDDSKGIEILNEEGKDNSLKYTLEQRPLPL
jgi:hypothetical protein